MTLYFHPTAAYSHAWRSLNNIHIDQPITSQIGRPWYTLRNEVFGLTLSLTSGVANFALMADSEHHDDIRFNAIAG